MSTNIVTTVLSAAATDNLADLALVKDELELQVSNTKHDTWLTNAIKRMSGMMASFVNRTLVPELLQDVIDVAPDGYPWHPGKGYPQVQLSRWPVIGIVSVIRTDASGKTIALTENVDFRVDAASGGLMRIDALNLRTIGWESGLTTVIYSAGYGALMTQAATIPASTPWQVTVSGAASFSCDHRVAFSSGTALTRVASAPAAGQYSVSTAGTYTFAAADANKAVNITYAQRVVPDDLVDICLRLVVARFRARGRDPMLMQRDTSDVGTERFWVGGVIGQDGPFTPDVISALDTYRVPVIA